MRTRAMQSIYGWNWIIIMKTYHWIEDEIYAVESFWRGIIKYSQWNSAWWGALKIHKNNNTPFSSDQNNNLIKKSNYDSKVQLTEEYYTLWPLSI